MYATDNTTQQALDSFQKFDADTRLALLWYGYLDIKDQLQPGPDASVTDPAIAIYHGIKALPQEEQLQAQRDIINRQNSTYSQQYTALASSAKIELWLLLAQGMENGEVIPVPGDYKLPAATEEFKSQIQQLEFEQRINFMRSAVMEMGAK